MTLLGLGLAAFLGVHIVPMLPRLRGRLVGKLGRQRYLGLYSLVSLLGLGMIVLGMRGAPYAHVYVPPPWGHDAARWIMPLAFVLLVATYLPGHLRKTLRHPMLLSISLWAVAHLLANGDLASVLLFGGFAVFAVVDLVSHRWREHGPERSARLWADGVAAILGAVGYYLALYLHASAGHPVG